MRLVDTSAWIEFLRDTKTETGDRVQDLVTSGEALWCPIVVLELWNGITFQQKKKLERIEEGIPSLQIDSESWELSRTLAVYARSKGITVPVPDLIIAACARLNGIEIEHHGDSHFEMLSTLSI